tara:strand:- start:703 stop:1635 length:933 start_codon:yes stop_codon:yes gene_type:complete
MNLLFENWNKFLSEEAQLEKGGEKGTISLPSFKISEKWGEPGTDDRQIIEMFTSKIKGNTLGEKIASLQQFVKDCDEACVATKDIPEILGNLVFLDSLASLIYDFNDKTGGFLFESILAVLLGGQARQVPTPGGRYQAIEDLLDAEGQPLSLKLLFAGPKYIKGSWQNLETAIEKYQQPIKYIVALKNREHKTGTVVSIDFYSFTIGNREGGFAGDFDSYDLSSGIYTRDIEKDEYFLGTLDLGSRENIKKIAQKYADQLGDNLTEIYDQMDKLSRNVNTYFLNSPDAKQAALKAQKNATTLKKDVDEYV